MTEKDAENFFGAVFTGTERRYLYSLPEFQELLARASDVELMELAKLGMQLLMKKQKEPSRSKELEAMRSSAG
jgi:hypothetical protein